MRAPCYHVLFPHSVKSNVYVAKTPGNPAFQLPSQHFLWYDKGIRKGAGADGKKHE